MRLLAVEQCRERYAQRGGDFPEKIDRRRALAGLDLAQHRPAYAGELCEAFEGVALPRPQAPQVPAKKHRQIIIGFKGRGFLDGDQWRHGQ